MPEDYEDLLREVIKLVGENAPKDQVMTKAWETKTDIVDRVTRLSLSVNTLDNLITWYAPERDWYYGWVNASVKSPASSLGGRQSSRSSRALQIADDKAVNDGGTVYTKDIAAQLQSEGDKGLLKSLSTAVGNILTSSGRYSRVRRGEYMQVASEEEVVA